jgi:DNA polymerase epsilon subunit 1
VPRIQHPDWLHKKILEKNDVLKQRKMTEMFGMTSKKAAMDVFESSQPPPDIEDIGNTGRTPLGLKNVSVTNKRVRDTIEDDDLSKSWRQVLGQPPARKNVSDWIVFQKKKWAWQRRQKLGVHKSKRARMASGDASGDSSGLVVRTGNRGSIGGFLKRTQRTLLDTPWQIIQIMETGQPGMFKLWALVGSDLHCIKLIVPRIFYVNQRTPKENEAAEKDRLWRRVQKTLPRSHPVLNLYEYRVPEEVYNAHASDLVTDLSTPDVEGIYETQVGTVFVVSCREAKIPGHALLHVDVVHFSKNIFSKNSNRFTKKIRNNLYFLTIVFGSKRPLLRYNMTIDYECKNISMKY